MATPCRFGSRRYSRFGTPRYIWSPCPPWTASSRLDEPAGPDVRVGGAVREEVEDAFFAGGDVGGRGSTDEDPARREGEVSLGAVAGDEDLNVGAEFYVAGGVGDAACQA